MTTFQELVRQQTYAQRIIDSRYNRRIWATADRWRDEAAAAATGPRLTANGGNPRRADYLEHMAARLEGNA